MTGFMLPWVDTIRYLGVAYRYIFTGQILQTLLRLRQLVAWHSGRTPVIARRTFPVLRSTCSWRM